MIRNFLLADDDQDDTELFEEALKNIDGTIRFTSAANGKELLEKLHMAERRPEIIFLDINMPDLNGWEVLDKIKSDELFKDIQVILYSTTATATSGARAFRQGAIGLYEKPPEFGRLSAFLKLIASSSPENLEKDLERLADSNVHKVYRH